MMLGEGELNAAGAEATLRATTPLGGQPTPSAVGAVEVGGGPGGGADGAASAISTSCSSAVSVTMMAG